MNLLDIEFGIDGLAIIGRDEICQGTRERIADGFLFEGCGFSVSAEFKKPLLVEEHDLTWDGAHHSTTYSDRAGFLRQVQQVWPGLAAHG
jgi:hypothetical protein